MAADLCRVPVFIGPMVLMAGAFGLLYAAKLWKVPLPALVSHLIVAKDTATNDKLRRFLVPANSMVFIACGIYMIVRSSQCDHVNLGLPNGHASFAFTAWPGIFLSTTIALLIGIRKLRSTMTAKLRMPVLVLYTGAGVAIGEAAGFHKGEHAYQWALISGVVIAAIAFVDWLDSRICTHSKNAATSDTASKCDIQ